MLVIASAPCFAQQTAAAEMGGPAPPIIGSTAASFDPTRFGTISVYLRDEDGKSLSSTKVTPIVRVASTASTVALPNIPQLEGTTWVFHGISSGDDYDVLVSVPGYYSTKERVHLPGQRGAAADVVILMRPVDQELVYHPPSSDFRLAPKAQKEIQHSLEDLQRGQVQSSLKHTQKALLIAPENPYVQYVMGLTYVLNQRFKEAQPYLEKSVSIDSREPLALSALGAVRYRTGDDAGAVQVLSRAIQLDPTLWKAEWTLAAAYIGEKKYADAREHAERALKLGKEKANPVELVLGEALAGLGEREQAAQLFDKFAADYPNDSNAATAATWARLMRQPAKVATSSNAALSLPPDAGSNAPLEPPVEIPPSPNWAPPDIDAVKPFVISGAACPLQQVLKTAGENAEQFVSTLEKFSATEEFQTIEITRDGALDKPSAQAYNYFVFVDRVTPTVFQINEVREQHSQRVTLSARLSDMGVPGLALAFHPSVQANLDWECEGVGKWNDQAAWVLHFQQRPDKPSVLAMFVTPSHSYPMALKGRAWVSESRGEVLHLDTDLVQELKSVDLKREHFSIDYKLVSFHEHDTDLRLPENVDTYIQYRGHFLHHYHHFSDFKLFWVGASQKISEPKQAIEPKKQDEQPQ